MDENKANDSMEPMDSPKPLFSLTYRIPLEDFIQFHLIMTADAVKKGKKKTAVIGWIEFLFAIGFLVALLTKQIEGHLFLYILVTVMILLGLYSILFYRFFYQKSVRRVLTKQHASTRYLQSDILLDFYDEKITEHVDDKQADTPWETIREFKTSDTLFLLMLDEKRCLLIPKNQLTEQEKEKLEQLLDKVSKNYGKPRYAV